MRVAGCDCRGYRRWRAGRRALLGYLEVHIEQGPVLLRENLPVGIVTSIAGDVRYTITVTGKAGHAGTVPMGLRHDAAAPRPRSCSRSSAAAARCATLVGTVGHCGSERGDQRDSGTLRALDRRPRRRRCDAGSAALGHILAEIDRIAAVATWRSKPTEMMRMPAVPCSAPMQARLAAAHQRAPVSRRAIFERRRP